MHHILIITFFCSILTVQPSYAVQLLSEPIPGKDAIELLNDQLGKILEINKLSARFTEAQFIELLESDDSIYLDERGYIIFVEQHIKEDPEDPPSSATTDRSTRTLPPAPPFPLEDTFFLHSRPDAKRVIHLDFDGHVIPERDWYVDDQVPVLEHPPWLLPGNTSFTYLELIQIQLIWQHVAELFSMFEVNVTTEEPSPDSLARTSEDDEYFGTRVVITPSRSEVFPGYAGMGPLNAFNMIEPPGSPPKMPAYLFHRPSDGTYRNGVLVSINRPYILFIANTIAHETGHTLGLWHHGQWLPEGETVVDYPSGELVNFLRYYNGHEEWSPIMGGHQYSRYHQWSKGEYLRARTDQNGHPQDDLEWMSKKMPFVTDDHSDNFSGATEVSLSDDRATILEHHGMISHRDDIDTFSIYTHGGDVEITINRSVFQTYRNFYGFVRLGAPLLIKATLYDINGNIIQNSYPPEGFELSGEEYSGRIAVEKLCQGEYYLTIEGIGYGNPLTDPPTGFTDYGSIGTYTLSGTLSESGDLDESCIGNGGGGEVVNDTMDFGFLPAILHPILTDPM